MQVNNILIHERPKLRTDSDNNHAPVSSRALELQFLLKILYSKVNNKFNYVYEY